MKTSHSMESGFNDARPLLAGTVRILWNAMRLPIAAALLALEPVVGFVCGLGLVLGIIASILFEISAVGPKFPFLKVLSISLSFGLILFFYYGLLSLFVED
jgi:hypothetical protein